MFLFSSGHAFKAIVISLGAQFVFSVQVLVGRSSWPCGKDYVTLLPSSTFLSPADCRLAKNRTVIRMFKKGLCFPAF